MKNANIRFNTPVVSVLMPMHNEEKHVGEAIESILNQSFTDFEFIILDDGSTDGCGEIALSYKDARIVYVKNEKNIGISNTMNKGIAIAKGKYLVRMDADDISLPKRIETQVAYMEANLEIGICGTDLMLFGARNGILRYRENDEELKPQLISGLPLGNATMITRKSELSKLKYWYDSEMDSAEDYDMTERLSHHTLFANIPEVYYYYRIHPSNSHLFHPKKLFVISMKIKTRNIESQIKRKLTPWELDIFYSALDKEEKALPIKELLDFHDLLLIIYKTMENKAKYPKESYSKIINTWWLNQIKKQSIFQIVVTCFRMPPLHFQWIIIAGKVRIKRRIKTLFKKLSLSLV